MKTQEYAIKKNVPKQNKILSCNNLQKTSKKTWACLLYQQIDSLTILLWYKLPNQTHTQKTIINLKKSQLVFFLGNDYFSQFKPIYTMA